MNDHDLIKWMNMISSNEFEHIFYCLFCCGKTFPLDGRSVLFYSQTYVRFCFSLLRALKAVVLQVAKRGWIDGQNRVILTGQLQPLILTHCFRAMMLCGEGKSLMCCSVTISLKWSTIYSRRLTRLALVGDNDVFAGFRAGILTKHRTHHRNLTLPSILALRHHFLTMKTHSDWNSLSIIMSFRLEIFASWIKEWERRSMIPEWLWSIYSRCFPLLCLGLRVGIDMDSGHGVHKTLRGQPQMF